jgi:hypothetical protein
LLQLTNDVTTLLQLTNDVTTLLRLTNDVTPLLQLTNDVTTLLTILWVQQLDINWKQVVGLELIKLSSINRVSLD